MRGWINKYVYRPTRETLKRVFKREGKGARYRARRGLREDKGRSRSKNSIISADARTSLGFPGADNGALFEESFCARDRDTQAARSLFLPFSRTHPPQGWVFLSPSLDRSPSRTRYRPSSFASQFLIRSIE